MTSNADTHTLDNRFRNYDPFLAFDYCSKIVSQPQKPSRTFYL